MPSGSLMKGLPVSRDLHPAAWWLWAMGVGLVATRTTNPWALLLLAGVVTVVTLACRTESPQAANFRLYALLAGFLLVVRMAFRLLFQGAGPTVLVNLPTIKLPAFLTGARLLGPISGEALLGGFETGAQLGLLVLCVGAANTLASAKRLLAAMPGALYELGTTVVVAVSVFPQLAQSVQRVSRSRLLRDDAGAWRHMVKDILMPVLSDALNRSLLLAGAMDSRGYGRAVAVTSAQRRLTSGLLIAAIAALSVGAFGVFNPAGSGWLMLLAGVALAGIAFRLAGSRAMRTRYRRDPWTAREWLVTASALSTAATGLWLSATPAVANPPVVPLAWPPLAWPMLATVAAALLPALQPQMKMPRRQVGAPAGPGELTGRPNDSV